MGAFQITFPHYINLADLTFEGDQTFTAANGDTLTAYVRGTASPIGPGSFAIHEESTITGGTGRFADATGHISGDGVASLVTLTVTIMRQGTITY